MSGLFFDIVYEKNKKISRLQDAASLFFYIYHSSVMFEMMTGLKGPSN